MKKTNVVRLNDYRPKQKSQYELYPLPFFNAEKLCTWDVRPTANYFADCRTGSNYAIEFLKSCDGTVGWMTLLGEIVADMIRAGLRGPTFHDGTHSVDGLVVGFMRVLGDELYIGRPETMKAVADWMREMAKDRGIE